MKRSIKELVQWLDYWADDSDKTSLRYQRIQKIRTRLIAESELVTSLEKLLSAGDAICSETQHWPHNWDRFYVVRMEARKNLEAYNNPKSEDKP